MSRDLFKLFENYELIEPKNRVSRIHNMALSDWLAFIDKLELILGQSENITASKLTAFDLSFPYPTITDLDHIPRLSLIFNKIQMVDLLSDYCNSFAGAHPDSESEFLTNIQFLTEANITPENSHILGIYLDSARRSWAQLIDATISKYLELKELIDERVLIPFIPLNPTYNFGDVQALKGLLTKVFEELPSGDMVDLPSFFHKIGDAKFISQIEELTRFFITSLRFKDLFPAEESSNLSLGGEYNKFILDKIIDLAGSALSPSVTSLHGIQWPKQEDEILVPMLDFIPATEILSVREKEKAALDNFKYKLQKNLLQLREAAGTTSGSIGIDLATQRGKL